MKLIKLIPLIMTTVVLGGCANMPPAKVIVREGLDEVQLACVIANDWTDDSSVLARVCNAAEEYIPWIKKFLVAKAKAAQLKKDGKASAPAPSSSK